MHAFSSPAWDKEVQADFGTSRALMFNPTTDTELTGRRLQFEAQVRVQQASEGQVRLSDSLSTVDFPKNRVNAPRPRAFLVLARPFCSSRSWRRPLPS